MTPVMLPESRLLPSSSWKEADLPPLRGFLPPDPLWAQSCRGHQVLCHSRVISASTASPLWGTPHPFHLPRLERPGSGQGPGLTPRSPDSWSRTLLAAASLGQSNRAKKEPGVRPQMLKHSFATYSLMSRVSVSLTEK